MPQVKASLHLLLVEDDPVDAEALLRNLQQHQLTLAYTHVVDGVEALYALRGERGYTPVPKPYLILLDIYLPRMNGLEFLSALRRDPVLKQSVVFVLTASESEADMMAAYNRQIAGYLLKAKVREEFFTFLKLLDLYGVMIEMPRWESTG